jgi:uncharacterized phage protein gp47/JayE
MAGLTSSGFVPETYETIKARIEDKLETWNPGFDFSATSPDGQFLGIMTYEIFQCWAQLNNVYNSNNPAISSGAALRNTGLMTGIPFGSATKSYVTCETQGTVGTVIPALSLVVDNNGNEYYTAFATAVPSNIQAVSKESGVLDVSIGSVVTIVTPVAGWTGITQLTTGTSGSLAQTQQQYRNSRQRTVMRNSIGISESIKSNLHELGIDQVSVVNNDTDLVVDSVPANTIAITLGEIAPTITDAEIAQIILASNSMGCPTYGTTSVVAEDSQGVEHTIKFTKATQFDIEIAANITFLSEDIAGAEESIKKALQSQINNLEAGEDVIWSRLFAPITAFGEAQVNSLTIGEEGGALTSSNISVTIGQFPNIILTDITLTVV